MTDPLTYLQAAHKRAEQTARKAADEDGEEWADTGEAVYVKDSNNPVAVGPWSCPIPDGERQHIAMHDPAAVLRRITAERKILAEHVDDGIGQCVVCLDGDQIGSRSEEPFRTSQWYPCTTVRLLAEAWGWQEGEQQ